jgi:transcriptional antiterminator RfaH
MTVTRRSGRVKHALFPRYVFVGLKPGRKLFDLRKTPHLGGIVKVAGKPYQVAPEILKGLRGAEAAGVYDFTDERLAELEVAARVERHMAARARALRDLVPNARVRIVDGPFRTFAGRVVELMLPDRVMIGIKLFGAEHPIPMEIGDVELARRAEP